MLDLKWIRENQEILDASLKRRGMEPQSSTLLSMDEKHRLLVTRLQELQNERNTLARSIGQAKSRGEEAAEFVQRSLELKELIPGVEQESQALAARIHDMLARIPNILDPDVPDGASEADNCILRYWGNLKPFSFQPKRHYELGEALGLMDFESAAKLSGSRFVVLRGALALLERALACFMIDLHTREFGYEFVSVPLLVREDAMFGTGQLPKFGEDAFRTTDGRWLIPTSEVPVTNLVREAIMDFRELPLRFVCFSPCFRSEAGSAGRDTRGMIRQHQFQKVELVSIVHPERSEEEHQRLVTAAETVLQRLELPYRVSLLCSGDTGATMRKTYDLEVWLPGEDTYREISSCSNAGDYQARRMNARFRENPEGFYKAPVCHLHTLNGSGVAVGRALVAVLENYQQEDGSIKIPHVLKPYMGNMEEIRI